MAQQKIGRNDLCPCGSGLKYKKCHGGTEAGPRSAPPPPSELAGPPREWKPFSELAGIEADRRVVIEEMFEHEFGFIDDCLALAAKQVEILGSIRPTSVEDVSMRDLGCDAFEFLYGARGAIASNRSSVAFPVMRRAFESVTLCNLFITKPEFAQAWAKGKTISNTDVWKNLEHNPNIGSITEIREVYKHFSQGTHANRTHIPYLFLGEGNQFTLGAIPPVDALTLGTHLRDLVQLCYWYVGVFLWFYRESLPAIFGSDFAREFLGLTPRLKEIRLTLDEQLDRLHAEHMKESRPEGIGPAYSVDT